MRAHRIISVSVMLLLLGWAAHAPAGPLFEDLGSGSATVGPSLHALARFTAPPDLSFMFFTLRDRSRAGCDEPCGPDARLWVSVIAAASDVLGQVMHAGVTMPSCDAGGPFSFGQNPCAAFDVHLSWHALLPPFIGETETTTAGAFAATIGIRTLRIGGQAAESASFLGGGSSLFTLAWQEDSSTWRFLSAEGHIVEPTPEPATLLLVGTTAAGLGLVRWGRRKRPS